jgi:putative photosynthetic complex assembly protein
VDATSSTNRFPVSVLIAAGLLIAAALGAVGWANITGSNSAHRQLSAVVARQAVVFSDQAGGTVVVANAGGQTLKVIGRGELGFVRALLRGLARDRRAQGIGPDVAFIISRHADGSLTLDDPSTGRVVALGAFGSTNSAVFWELLAAEAPTQVSTASATTGTVAP